MSEEIEAHILKRYEVLKRIGKGAYGIVIYLCNHLFKILGMEGSR
jgi:hypothetical protein